VYSNRVHLFPNIVVLNVTRKMKEWLVRAAGGFFRTSTRPHHVVLGGLHLHLWRPSPAPGAPRARPPLTPRHHWRDGLPTAAARHRGHAGRDHQLRQALGARRDQVVPLSARAQGRTKVFVSAHPDLMTACSAEDCQDSVAQEGKGGEQGLTFVHFLAQLKQFCGTGGECRICLEGV